MIVKNGYSISFGDNRRGVHLSNTSRGNTLNNPKKKKTINNQSSSSSSSSSSAPPEPDNSDVACLNLAAGLYKKKYEGYFYENDDFFNTRLVSSFIDDYNTANYTISNVGSATEQNWYNWGFVPASQYDTPEAIGSPFPSIGKGVTYFGFGFIENPGTASVSPVAVSEEVTSQIDDNYSSAQGQNNKSLIIKGYFKPTVNGVYKFRLFSDDGSYLWFGNDAFDGNRSITRDAAFPPNVTATNAVVSLPGLHGPYYSEGIFTMTANSYYPLTVEFGNGPEGEGVLIFDYMPPGSDTWTSDLAGKLFYDIDSKGHRVCAPPSAYFGRVLSLDAVPYDRNPNQISFDGAGVQTVDGVYVYTQTGSPIPGSMFHDTGFYGPVVSGKNNLIEFDVQYGKTGYFVGDWIENDYTYFNTGNIPFVNRVEIQGGNLNVNATYTRANSGDNAFFSDNGRRIIKNQNSGWDLQDDDQITLYTNDDINLNPNGWYYNYINTIIISNAGTASSNGTYTRNSGGETTFDGPNGNQLIFVFYEGNDLRFNLFDVSNDNSTYSLNINYVTINAIDIQGGDSPAPNGLTTTARYYPANRTDGLLGIQYSGYFDGNPTWFNTASVKPIINELTLAGASEGTIGGTYTRVGDQNNQGTSYFQGPNGWRISYYSQFPAAESYWFLHPGDYNQYYTSNDLKTWAQGPQGDTPPTATITQTQNSENSTNFGTTRALSNDTSWQWVGYFRANDTSNHNFYISADEDAYFWIGDKALNGYTTGNSDMYSIANISTNITNLPLTSGVYYPVRLQWGHPANPTFAGLSLSYRNGAQASTNDFSGVFFNFTGDGIATNSNGYVYDFTLGEWQSTNIGYNPAPNAVYSHVWLDSISGFNNSGVMYTGNKHVTLVNNPTYSSDYSGIYSFNGVNQYALTQEVVQSADGSISYFVWFKPTGAGVVVDELGQPGLFGGWHDSQLEVTQDGKVNFGIWGDYRTNSTFKIQSTGSIDFNRWYHLGLTYFSGVLSAYINGEKIADSNCQRMNGPTNLYYAICGGDSTNMGEGGFGKGSVGSFQVYNTGLTEIQVGNLYSGEKDRFPNIDNMFFPSLWLDASTGVNKFSYNYISQIVLSGNPSGTYNASSIPSYNFGDGIVAGYSFSGPSNGFSMIWNEGSFVLIKDFPNGAAIYESSDGQTWTITSEVLTQVVISGFDGDYEGANGSYTYNPDYEALSNGYYAIYGTNIENVETDEVLATNTNANYSGNWTLVNGTGDPATTSATIIPNGSISGITTTSTANTDYVASWEDQSENGNNATAQDTYPTFIASSINSKPAISFNNDGSFMQIPENNIGNDGNISIFVVLNYSAGAILLNKGDAATFEATVWEITTFNGFGFVDPADGDPAWNVVPISIATGTPLLLEAFSDETISQLAFNGVNSGEPSDGNEFGTNNISQYIGIGGGGTNGESTAYLDARIAEIIIYNRSLNTSERQEVENYLKNKYAFSDTIYWGEDYSTACAQTLPLVVTGDGLTFCDSNTFRGQDLVGLGTGPIYISYNGQLKTLNHVNGDNFVTFNGDCGPCPSIPSAPNLSVIDGSTCGEVILQWDAIDGGLPITSYSWYNPFDGIGQEELINIGNNGLNASIIDQRFVDTSYSFKIKVQNELGTSEWSNIVNFTATTSNCSVPSAPYDLSVSNEDPDVCLLGLSYERPVDPQGNINYYELATNEDGDNWTNIGIQGSNIDTAFIGLPAGETSREYFIRVRAVNSVGASPAVGPQSVILSKCI